MSTIKYTGARYLLKFYDEWVQTDPHEALGVVQVNGFTYLSKQPVPAGVEITDTNFWLEWADPNAQMEQLRQLVEQYRGELDDIEQAIADTVAALEELRGALATEAQTREEADNALEEDIAAEAQAREEADTALQTAIQTETTNRTAKDAELTANINKQALRFKTYSLANCTPLVGIETGVTSSKLTIIYDNYLKTLTLSGWLTFTDYLTTPPTEILRLPNEIDDVISQVYQTCGGIISGTDKPWRSNDYAFADLYINPGRKLAIKSPQMIEGGTKGIYLNTVINMRPNIATA